MGHNHNHHHDHHSDGHKNIRLAFFLNLLFTVLEIVGGLLTNSMAILSDALHDLGDSLSLGIAWYFQRYSEKKPDRKFTYGYARFSLLGALINSIVLVVGSVLIFVHAIPRLFQPEAVNPKGMLIFAILGIVINGIAVLRLKKSTSLNEKVVFWHLMEDVLGWVVIFLASIVMLFVEIPVLDPILSILITVYVLYHVVVNLKEILTVFLQGVPGKLSIHEIEDSIVRNTRVISVHHTHIWSLEGEKIMLSTHVVMADGTDRDTLILMKKEIRDLLQTMGIEHVTIEVDFETEPCDHDHCH